MGEIGQIFLNLGKYSGPVLIGLLELLVGVWLFGMFLKLNLKEKRKRKKKSFFVRSVRLRMKFQSQKRYVKDIYRILQAKRNLVL